MLVFVGIQNKLLNSKLKVYLNNYLFTLASVFQTFLNIVIFMYIYRYMAEDFSIKPACDMYKLLSENIKAAEAELVLAERFPEVLVKVSNKVSTFTVFKLLF